MATGGKCWRLRAAAQVTFGILVFDAHFCTHTQFKKKEGMISLQLDWYTNRTQTRTPCLMVYVSLRHDAGMETVLQALGFDNTGVSVCESWWHEKGVVACLLAKPAGD